jgi:hypothetical protein
MSVSQKRNPETECVEESAKKTRVDQSKVFPLDFLPNDVISHILKFLPPKDVVSFNN